MADTDISLSIDLDVKDAEATAKDLQKEIEKIFDSRKGEQSAALTNMEIQMKKNYDAAKNLSSALEEIGANRDTAKYYYELTKEIEQSESAMRSMQKIMDETVQTASKQLASPILFEDSVMINTVDELRATIAQTEQFIASGEGSADAIAQAKEELVALKYEYLAYDNALETTTVKYKDQEMSLAELRDLYDSTQDKLNELQKAQQNYDMELSKEEAFKYYQKLNQEYNATETKLDSINDKLKQQYIHQREIQENTALKEQQRLELEQQKRIKEEAEQAAQAQRDARMETIAANSSLMALNMGIRAIGRVIPGVSTSAISGVIMLTRSMTRLTSVTSAALMKAITNIGDAIYKLFTFIASHPIVLLIAAAVAAIVVLAKKLKEMWDEAQEMSKKILEGLVDGVQEVGELAVGYLATVTKGFIKLGNVIPSALIRVVQTLINKLKSLKSIISENLDLMAKWNDGNNAVNEALSNITSSLAYLKASLATAVAPLLTYVEPVLTRLIDLLAEVLNIIGMVIAKITGATTYQRAIRVQNDYAESLENTAKSANDASAGLASFDKLNVLNSDKNGSSKAKTVDFKLFDLQDTQLPDWIKDFSKLGKKLGKTLKKFLKNIGWDKIKEEASKLGSSIADFINGFFEVPDIGATIGHTLAEGLNTITTTINSFLENLHTAEIGTQIAEALTSFLHDTDFIELGDIFSNTLNDLAGILYNFTLEFNGEDLGGAMTDFITGAFGHINWTLIDDAISGLAEDLAGALNKFLTPENLSLVGTTLANTLNTLITGIKVFTNTAEWQQWGESIGTAIGDFFKTFDWEGAAQAINGVALGILELLKSAIDALFFETDPETGKVGVVSIAEKIAKFIRDLDWEKVADYATTISKHLRAALAIIWEELNKPGEDGKTAFDHIIGFVRQFLEEKANWERLFAGFQFKLSMEYLWDEIKGVFTGIGDKIWSVFQIVGQKIAEFFTWLFSSIGSVEDDLKSDASAIGVTGIPGLNIGTKKAPEFNLTTPKISGYASGVVIPPNKPFLGVLGDQSSGTNVEAPLSTIKQAVAEVVGEMGIKVVFDVQGDPNRIFKATQKEAKIFYNQTHQPAFAN